MRSIVSAAVILAALIAASPAAAITNGSPDGDGHPNVAGLVNDTQYSDGTWIYCSGTLIAPKIVLTAAHCNDDGARTRVTFDTAYVDEGPTLKRFQPRAQGRAFRIRKRTCHITIELVSVDANANQSKSAKGRTR